MRHKPGRDKRTNGRTDEAMADRALLSGSDNGVWVPNPQRDTWVELGWVWSSFSSF